MGGEPPLRRRGADAPAPDRAVPPRPGIAGRYTLASGGEIEISWQNGRLVLATADPEAILRLNFPDALAPDLPGSEDEQMTRIFRGIDSGDWEPLRAALGLDQSFEGMQKQTRSWWETQKEGAWRLRLGTAGLSAGAGLSRHP